MLVTVLELLWIEVTLVTVFVELVIPLVVLELVVELLETVVLSEVDIVLLIALARLVESCVDESTELIVEVVLAFDTGEITDSIVVELVNVLFDCVCARTITPDEHNESSARRLTATTIPILTCLLKPATFASTGLNLRAPDYATTASSSLITIEDESSYIGEQNGCVLCQEAARKTALCKERGE
jgi:hypothetical protein